ncbi:triacylglycerol lipase [Streptomyces sp. HNM0575]|uniref:lipase family protein n=1 Tax=Streptomyces sp. HNM0575 TaxID=2716338 RepID=UPI00145FB46A|nr:lipase family protein [Streptomyces sp. HNM0575]NLU71121.1 triacylglycerol lipase [Streptomyces sp. HNM0575]
MGQVSRNLRARTGLGRTARLAAVAVAALACLGAQAVPAGAADGPEQPSVPSADVPAFYDPPAQLPQRNGDLVRSEPLPLPLSLPGPRGPLPGEATRLMYKSTDSNGNPVAVTGAYVEPSAEWKGGGPRPVIALAPGTMGQGDQCAASLALEHPLSFDGRSVSVGYEDLAIYRLLSAGVAVVLTDYAGLGATDRLHTYVDRRDEGHAVLDAVRAARRLDGASVGADSRVGLYGYSQGGGASAAAAELQPSYAPDVELAGAYAGAPPADLAEVVKGIDGSALTGALAWSVNGFLQSDPSLKEVADRNINSAGRAALKDLSTRCTGDAVFTYGFQHSEEWTTSGKSLTEIIADEPKLRATLEEQRLGSLKPEAPVRVATGTQDDIVGHEQARRLAVDWCKKGADVTYKPVQLPNLGDKLLTNHLAPLLVDQGEAISWLTDRLSGQSAASECSQLSGQP